MDNGLVELLGGISYIASTITGLVRLNKAYGYLSRTYNQYKEKKEQMFDKIVKDTSSLFKKRKDFYEQNNR